MNKELIEKAWEDRSMLQDSSTLKAIEDVIEQLDKCSISGYCVWNYSDSQLFII